MNPNLVNAQLEVVFQCGIVVLKRIKDCKAGGEILISFGMASWAVYFGCKINVDKKFINNEFCIKAGQAYNLQYQRGIYKIYSK